VQRTTSKRDTAEFFTAAHTLLQQIFGGRWNISPERITTTELDAHLDGVDADDIRQIFALADEANYSGDHLKAADFDRWTQIVRRQLAGEKAS
jgi:hypothetical protein